MNILLTGGTGYIGSHVAVVLNKGGHSVVLLDNFCNSQKVVLGQLKKILGKTFSFFEGDVRDLKLIIELLQTKKIDAVIHLAGLKSVGESSNNPLEYYSNNVQGAISLLQAMQECHVGKLVFSSSATVYGNPQYLPIDEEHPTAPINPYGRTKLQVEQILQDVCNADKNFRVTSLRYFNPVGADESGLIGENPKGIPNNLMPFLTQVSAGKQKWLSIYGDDYSTPDGTGVRDYIHVTDLALGHLSALNFLKNNKGMSTFNLGAGFGYSVLDLIEAFQRQSGKKIPYKIAPRREGDIATCYANIDKAKLILNWSPQYSLDDMCASAWKWQQSLEVKVNKNDFN